MLAATDRLHYLADVDAVLDHRVARLVVLQRDLVADRDVALRGHLDVLVILHDPAGERLAGLDTLDDDHADAVAFLVHDEMDHFLLHMRSDYSIRMFRRRRFLQGLAALGVSSALPACAQPRFASYPFTLGVASGYPSASSVALWTRLTGAEPAPVTVRWEVAADEGMKRVVASGSSDAGPRWAHSVHVEAGGLEPGRWYWYRFTAGDAQSAIGRTRTAPAKNAGVERLRFAFASCQQYEQGWFGAYRHIAADTPDLVAFLGDYIYESTWGRDHVRKHGAAEPYTLEDYRARHALYRSDL